MLFYTNYRYYISSIYLLLYVYLWSVKRSGKAFNQSVKTIVVIKSEVSFLFFFHRMCGTLGILFEPNRNCIRSIVRHFVWYSGGIVSMIKIWAAVSTKKENRVSKENIYKNSRGKKKKETEKRRENGKNVERQWERERERKRDGESDNKEAEIKRKKKRKEEKTGERQSKRSHTRRVGSSGQNELSAVGGGGARKRKCILGDGFVGRPRPVTSRNTNATTVVRGGGVVGWERVVGFRIRPLSFQAPNSDWQRLPVAVVCSRCRFDSWKVWTIKPGRLGNESHGRVRQTSNTPVPRLDRSVRHRRKTDMSDINN